MSELLKKVESSKHRYLVYTSAGDNANIHYWLKGKKTFDLWITYYGDEDNKHIESADYYNKRKGAKFPNIKYAYDNFPDVFKRYDYVYISDDDLIIDATDISSLFDICRSKDIYLLQPAFDRRGKISFKINEAHPFSFMRYTNFVEVACPMVERKQFEKFMNVYDSQLVGWGVDIWLSHLINSNDTEYSKIAVVDQITCINPRETRKKDGIREIDLLQSKEKRLAIWASIADRENIAVRPEKISYATVTQTFSFLNFYKSARIIAIKAVVELVKRFKGEKWRPS